MFINHRFLTDQFIVYLYVDTRGITVRIKAY